MLVSILGPATQCQQQSHNEHFLSWWCREEPIGSWLPCVAGTLRTYKENRGSFLFPSHGASASTQHPQSSLLAVGILEIPAKSRTASEMRSSPYRSARVTNAETAPEAHDVVTRSRADDLGSTCSAPYHQPVELFDREVAGFLEQSSLSTGLRTAECMRQHAQLKSLRGRPHFASVLCNPSAPSLRWHAALSGGQLDQRARDLVHAPARSWIRAYTKLVGPKCCRG